MSEISRMALTMATWIGQQVTYYNRRDFPLDVLLAAQLTMEKSKKYEDEFDSYINAIAKLRKV